MCLDLSVTHKMCIRDRVKVEGAHEALVSYEDFMAVKTMMKRDMRCSPDQDEAHLLDVYKR